MKIGVVGLGLIGGSTFKKLKALKYDVVGISNSQNGKDQNITNNIKNETKPDKGSLNINVGLE